MEEIETRDVEAGCELGIYNVLDILEIGLRVESEEL